MNWKYFGLLFLILGLIVIYTVFYLFRHGLISEPFGYMRLHDANTQGYLSEINNLPEQKLKTQLKQIIQNNSRTIYYWKNSHFTVDYKSSYLANERHSVLPYQSTIKTRLNRLDQLVYATSLSNSDRSKDVWNIHVFCSDQKRCIENLSFRNQQKHLKQKNHDGLFRVQNKDKAQQSIALLHRLIKLNGGKAVLDDSKSITYLLNDYQQNSKLTRKFTFAE